MRRSMLLFSAGAIFLAVSFEPGVASETITYSYDALGRLVQSSIVGGLNNAKSTATCFDPGGNRKRYFTGTGAAPSCATTPTPTPTPSTNQPPLAIADAFSLPCNTEGNFNLTQNDSDPDGNIPLSLQSITRTSGTAEAIKISSSSVSVSTYLKGQSNFSYVISDSLGATSVGTLNITSTGDVVTCAGGLDAPPEEETSANTTRDDAIVTTPETTVPEIL